MLNMKISNGRVRPAFRGGIARTDRFKMRGDSMLPNARFPLSYADFPREQGTRYAKRLVGVMTRPRFAG